MTNKRYSDELLAEAVRNSYSYAGVLRYLKINWNGSSQAYYRSRITKLGLDVSHFGRNKGRPKHLKNSVNAAKLIHDPELAYRYSGEYLRRVMLLAGVEYKCANEECRVGAKWLGNPITLDVDHIDGNWKNNSLDNLRFLCGNCHKQTKNYCNRQTITTGFDVEEFYAYLAVGKMLVRRNKIKSKTCANADCLEEISPQAERCRKHEYQLRSARRKKEPCHKIEWPSVQELLDRLSNAPYTTVAEQLGVSDNAIRKHLRSNGVTPPGNWYKRK